LPSGSPPEPSVHDRSMHACLSFDACVRACVFIIMRVDRGHSCAATAIMPAGERDDGRACRCRRFLSCALLCRPDREDAIASTQRTPAGRLAAHPAGAIAPPHRYMFCSSCAGRRLAGRPSAVGPVPSPTYPIAPSRPYYAPCRPSCKHDLAWPPACFRPAAILPPICIVAQFFLKKANCMIDKQF
jgi:hypothetical protein